MTDSPTRTADTASSSTNPYFLVPGSRGDLTAHVLASNSTTILSSQCNTVIDAVPVPEALLSLDVESVASVCPDHEALIRSFRVTPLNCLIGLVPNRVRKADFEVIRGQFLGSLNAISFSSRLPSFICLSQTSSSADIKTFLVCCGVAGEKVDRLPDSLTYDHLTSGTLGPALDKDDLTLVWRYCTDISKCLNDYSAYLKGSDMAMYNKISMLFQELTCSDITLQDLSFRVMKCPDPNSLKNMQVAQVQKSLYDCAVLEEYKVPFKQYKATIVDSLVADIVARYNIQKTECSYFKDKSVFAPVVHLTNASGTGKTRSAIELGSLTNVLFFKFGGSNGLLESKVGVAIVDFLAGSGEIKLPGCDRLSASLAVHAIFQRIIYMCKIVYDQKGLEGCIMVDNVVEDYIDLLVNHSNYHRLVNMSAALMMKSVLFDGLDAHLVMNQETIQKFEAGQVIPFLSTQGIFEKWAFAMAGIQSLSGLTSENETWLEKRAGDLHSRPMDIRVQTAAKGLPKLLIVLDEAHCLLKEYNDNAVSHIFQANFDGKLETFRLLRGTFRFLEFYWGCMCVTISTVAKTVKFSDPKDDPSFRMSDSMMHDPMVLKHTLDSFCDGQYSEQSVGNWMRFLFSQERVLHITSCGRPLWSAHLVSRLCAAFYATKDSDVGKYGICQNVIGSNRSLRPFQLITENCMTEPFKKLGRLVKLDKSVFTFSQFGENEAVALLALSVALRKFPTDIDMAELVRVGPMILLDFVKDNVKKSHMAVAVACSEGLFNGASTLMLLTHLEDVLKWLKGWIQRSDRCLMSRGEIGEVVDRIVVLKAVSMAGRAKVFEEMELEPVNDPRSISEFIFEPVSFEEFLDCYAGATAAQEYLNKHDGLRGSFVAFTHFYYMGMDDLSLDPYGVAANALSRGAAVVPREGTPGLDMFIPLVLRTGELSFIYIQTKLGASYRKSRINENDVATSSPHHRFKLTLNHSRPYCYLFRIYTGEPESSHKVYLTPTRPTGDANPKEAEKIFHQPCLALTGALNLDDSVLEKFINWLCETKNYERMQLVKSLERAWTVPNRGVRRDKKLPNDLTTNKPYSDYFTEEDLNFEVIKEAPASSGDVVMAEPSTFAEIESSSSGKDTVNVAKRHRKDDHS